MPNIVLCADTVSSMYPSCLGLDGEILGSQEWLRVLNSASEARIQIREQKPDAVWVAGSNEIEGINLAAALKADNEEQKVCLLAFEGNGSLLSRARAAQIDEVWDKQSFLQQYALEKSRSIVPALKGLEQEESQEHTAAPKPQNVEGTQVSQGSAIALADRGYLLSIVGAGGGVGKSSIAVVCAYIAQSKGYRCVLVDADLQFGDIQFLTGRDDSLSLDEAIASPSKLEALDCTGRQPAILSAPVRLEQSEELLDKIPGLIESLRTRFDVVVVNTSPAWNDIHLQLLDAGGNTLFLLDQRPSSIRSCKHALQLCARCGIATAPIVFALNRCSRQSLFSSIDVTCALQGARVVELSEGGRDVEELLGTGAPLELLDSGNALCQSVARVLADLLPQQTNQNAPVVSIPSRKRFKFGPRRKKAACL